MDKLLDKEVHPQYKAPSLVTYLSPRHSSSHAPSTSTHHHSNTDGNVGTSSTSYPKHGSQRSLHGTRASELDEIGLTDQRMEFRQDEGSSVPKQMAGASNLAAGARPKTSYMRYPQRYT